MTLRQKLLTLNSSLLITFFSLEILLRVFLPAPLERNLTFDSPNAELYGWAMPPNANLTFINPDNGKITPLRTNSKGWGDVEHSLEKPPGVLRILFIGDSNTAIATPTPTLYTRQVERLLHEAGFPQVEVISIGVGAWGTDQALEALRLEGLSYAPDLVIHQFDENDLFGILWQELGSEPRPFRYVLEGDELLRLDNFADWQAFAAKRKRPFFLKNSHLLRYINRSGQSLFAILDHRFETSYTFPNFDPTSAYYMFPVGDYSPEMAAAWRLWEAMILEMQALSAESGAAFMIFSQDGEAGKLAAWQRLYRSRGEILEDRIIWEGQSYPFDFTRPNQEISRLLADDDIPLIFPQRVYTRYQHDGHANPEGNLRMAEDIVDFLRDWLNCGENETCVD